MQTQSTLAEDLILDFADAWHHLQRRLDSSLGAIRGISLAEYRLLKALGDAPNGLASRVDLAQMVGLTPSGITRALRPLEKLGVVSTVKSKRDARLAVASLTPAGRELLNDASSVVSDTMEVMLERSPKATGKILLLSNLMKELARA